MPTTRLLDGMPAAVTRRLLARLRTDGAELRVHTGFAEFALEDNSKPVGIAEYLLVESLPEPLQTALPRIEQIERELGGGT